MVGVDDGHGLRAPALGRAQWLMVPLVAFAAVSAETWSVYGRLTTSRERPPGNDLQAGELTWRNCRSISRGRIGIMMTFRDAASLATRLLLVAALIASSLGSTHVMDAGHRGSGLAQVFVGTMDHDCCDQESSGADPACALACAQAPCGYTVTPVTVAWPVGDDERSAWRLNLVAIPNGIAPDLATPPPRA